MNQVGFLAVQDCPGGERQKCLTDTGLIGINRISFRLAHEMIVKCTSKKCRQAICNVCRFAKIKAPKQGADAWRQPVKNWLTDVDLTRNDRLDVEPVNKNSLLRVEARPLSTKFSS